jgi:hypothetical protein
MVGNQPTERASASGALTLDPGSGSVVKKRIAAAKPMARACRSVFL